MIEAFILVVWQTHTFLAMVPLIVLPISFLSQMDLILNFLPTSLIDTVEAL
jgi:hypothetical protein